MNAAISVWPVFTISLLALVQTASCHYVETDLSHLSFKMTVGGNCYLFRRSLSLGRAGVAMEREWLLSNSCSFCIWNQGHLDSVSTSFTLLISVGSTTNSATFKLRICSISFWVFRDLTFTRIPLYIRRSILESVSWRISLSPLKWTHCPCSSWSNKPFATSVTGHICLS